MFMRCDDRPPTVFSDAADDAALLSRSPLIAPSFYAAYGFSFAMLLRRHGAIDAVISCHVVAMPLLYACFTSPCC